MKYQLLLSTLLMVLLQSSCRPELNKPDTNELEQAEETMFKAFGEADTATFRSLCSPQYFTINADGHSQQLEEALAGMLQFNGSRSERKQVKQRLFDNLALRTGHATFYFGDTPVAKVLFTTGWLWNGRQWKFVHWQGTPTTL